MKRTPIVLAATVAGLVGVLSFHTPSASLSAGLSQGVSTTRGTTSTVAGGSPPRQKPTGTTSSTPTTTPTTTPSSTPTTTSPSSSSTTTLPRPPSTTTTTSPSGTKTATGELVNYNYGVLSVSITVSGKKITNVKIASLDDGGNFRSQSIDQQSIPVLEQEALQAQSANIQSVSGASYTSAGFQQSLQSAMSKAGLA